MFYSTDLITDHFGSISPMSIALLVHMDDQSD